MNVIVAVDEHWGIGKNNDLLFHIPEDMRFFRSMTIGKTVICGKNTLLSFPGGKPLPDRKHCVLTHSDFLETEQLVTFDSVEKLLSEIAELPADDVLVIGGESVYKQLLPHCRKAFVTKIFQTDPEAMVFFPNLDEHPDFDLTEVGEKQISKNGIEFSFLTYTNNKD